MGRPAKYRRDELLESCTELFRACGYEISMRDIFKATGINPNSLYSEFGNKNKLFILCLDNYRQRMESSSISYLYEAPRSICNIKKFLISYIDNTDEYGCLIMNSLTNRISIPKEAGIKIDEYYFNIGDAILKCLISDNEFKHYQKGQLKLYTTFIIGILQGSIISIRQGIPEHIIHKQIEIALTARP